MLHEVKNIRSRHTFGEEKLWNILLRWNNFIRKIFFDNKFNFTGDLLLAS